MRDIFLADETLHLHGTVEWPRTVLPENYGDHKRGHQRSQVERSASVQPPAQHPDDRDLIVDVLADHSADLVLPRRLLYLGRPFASVVLGFRHATILQARTLGLYWRSKGDSPCRSLRGRSITASWTKPAISEVLPRYEGDPNPPLLAPRNLTGLAQLLAMDDQREFFRKPQRTVNLDGRACLREVANRARERAAGKSIIPDFSTRRLGEMRCSSFVVMVRARFTPNECA